MSALRDLIDPVKNRQKNLNNPIEVLADSYRIYLLIVPDYGGSRKSLSEAEINKFSNQFS